MTEPVPPEEALEANLGDLSDDEYFDDLNAVKAAGVVGRDEAGNVYELDEGVRDERPGR